MAMVKHRPMSTRTPRHPGIDCDHLGDHGCARCAAAWEATEWLADLVRVRMVWMDSPHEKRDLGEILAQGERA